MLFTSSLVVGLLVLLATGFLTNRFPAQILMISGALLISVSWRLLEWCWNLASNEIKLKDRICPVLWKKKKDLMSLNNLEGPSSKLLDLYNLCHHTLRRGIWPCGTSIFFLPHHNLRSPIKWSMSISTGLQTSKTDLYNFFWDPCHAVRRGGTLWVEDCRSTSTSCRGSRVDDL